MSKTTDQTKPKETASTVTQDSYRTRLEILADNGFVEDKDGAYNKGLIRILPEVTDRPCMVVQMRVGSTVKWFVDFPLDVDVLAVLAFINAL